MSKWVEWVRWLREVQEVRAGASARAAHPPAATGHEGPPGDFRFSDRVFGRAALALAVAAVQAARRDNVRAACNGATVDSEGRFFFSAVKVGVERWGVAAAFATSLSLSLCPRPRGAGG